MRLAFCLCAAAAALLGLLANPAAAQAPSPEADNGLRWVTLGTRAGPVPSATRAQPANLLVHQGRLILVDVGDGVSMQLARRGHATAQVEAVFISHLHFDHTAGLAGMLGLRWQTNAPRPLVVYGPPQTAALVAGLVASMEPGAMAGYGVPGAVRAAPADGVRVVELRDGDSVDLDGLRVRVRANTHYSFEPGSDLERDFQSLSFRFETDERSVVYSGDTGPSEALVELAQGADLLVTEMMDIDYTIANVRRLAAPMPAQALADMERHLRSHHLLPEDVGQLAAAAGVGAVVATHFSGRERTDPGHAAYLATIARHYSGPVVIANDMDEF